MASNGYSRSSVVADRIIVAAVQLAEGAGLIVGGECLLGKCNDFAVVGRDKTRRAEQVGLAQTAARHGLVVIGKTEVRPDEIKDAGRHRLDVACGQ